MFSRYLLPLLIVFALTFPPVFPSELSVGIGVPKAFPCGEEPEALAYGDFNGDNDLDLAVVNGDPLSPGVTLLFYKEKGFPQSRFIPVGKRPVDLAVADPNNDGKLDIALADPFASQVIVLFGDGQGNFPHRVTLKAGPNPSAVLFLDVNEDEQIDLVVGDISGEIISYLGNGRGVFRRTSTFRGERELFSLSFSDVNHDGKIDLLSGSAQTVEGSVSTFLGQGDGSFSRSAVLRLPPALGQVWSISPGDFNWDGRPDVAFSTDSHIAVALGDGYGRFKLRWQNWNYVHSRSYVKAADLNRDGNLDLVVSTLGKVRVFQGQGDGTFSGPVEYIGRRVYGAVLVADYDYDGWADVVVAVPSADSQFDTLGDQVILLPNASLRPSRPVADRDRFRSAEFCGKCHPRQYKEWKGSIHAFAATDPANLVMNAIASRDTRGLSNDFCFRCHSPKGFLFQEFLPPDKPPLSDLAQEGVSCDFCHSVAHGKIGNNVFELGPVGVSFGPGGFANKAHTVVQSSFLRTSEFCGLCHDVTTRDRISGVPFPAERTYSEWKNSVYALAGVTCQKCHMKPRSGEVSIAEGGPPRPQPSTHYFPGADLVISPFAEEEDQQREVQRLLKSSADLMLIAPTEISRGSLLQLGVQVTNSGAGHFLPTGTSEHRELWLEVIVRDRRGRIIFSSGLLDPSTEDLLPDPHLVLYQTRLRDAYDRPVEFPWQANPQHTRDKRIPPLESVLEKYTVPLPWGVEGPLEVAVRLRFRQYPPRFLRMLGIKPHKPLMITDIAQDKAWVQITNPF